MENSHSLEDLLDFLNHAGERGLMPAATAQALAVAARNVFSVLDDSEKAEIPVSDLDGIIRRFNNKRARDFNPASLKEYGRRVRRAVDLYLQWKEDPANFTVKTRATIPSKKKERAGNASASTSGRTPGDEGELVGSGTGVLSSTPRAYQTAFPIRPGHVVTISNIPSDLTPAESDRLAQFIRFLAPGDMPRAERGPA